MDTRNNTKNINKLINEKMRCLDDFSICDKDDTNMKDKLLRAINENPDKDPQRVLDYYCRPLIQKKVNSWT